MHNRDKRIPLDAEVVEDEACRFDLQVDVPPLALEEPHVSLLYFTRTLDSCRQDVERRG